MLDGRIPVTGGADLLGHTLWKRCWQRPQRSGVLDNLSTGKVGNLPVGNANLNLVVPRIK